MKFISVKDFENYVNNKGFKVCESYPSGFLRDFRDYNISVILNESDDSFDYSFFIETQIRIPSAFFTDETGNKPSFSLSLIKI